MCMAGLYMHKITSVRYVTGANTVTLILLYNPEAALRRKPLCVSILAFAAVPDDAGTGELHRDQGPPSIPS